MEKKVIIVDQSFIRPFYWMIVFVLIFSCSQNNKNQPEAFENNSTLKPPVSITGIAPIVTLLDTCPPPITITIPENRKDSFVLKINNSKRVIHSPEIRPADFSVLMPNYNTEQGLDNSAVMNGCMDHYGNLWFATFGGGISRYDGKTFTNYNTAAGLPANLATCIIEDNDKNLWIGTNAGVSRYNGRFFTNYTMAQGLVNNFIQCIFQDKDGNIWIGTNGGISKYDLSAKQAGGKVFTNYTTAQGLINNFVQCIVQDKNGNFWFGTSAGLSRLDRDGKSFKSYTTAEGLVNNNIICIHEDKIGNLWFGTGWGVSRMDQNGSFNSYATPVELANKGIRCVHEDKLGNLWFGTWEGVFRLKGDGSWMHLNAARGLANNQVNSILEDIAGNLWFCTEDGISRFDQEGKFFFAYTTEQGLTNNAVSSFCEDKGGNLWFGTFGGGVSKLDKEGKTFTNYTAAQGLPDNGVRSMAEDKAGNLWFGTQWGGVCRFDRARKIFTIYTVSQGLAGNSIRCIAQDKAGNIWFGSAGQGVSMLDKEYKSITTYTTTQGLSSNEIRDITEDRIGNLWFNTLGGGISRLDKDRKSFTNYTTEQGLGNNYSWPGLEDENGNLWIGTEIGLSRFDGKTFTNYSKADGLADNESGSVAMNIDGVIWLGSNKGFTALKGFVRYGQSIDSSYKLSLKPSNELSNAELKKVGYKPVFEIYGHQTGFAVKAINNIGVTRQGTIWAGTGGFLGDKLIRFDFGNVSINQNPPNVILQSIKINNETISWYDLIAPDRNDGPPDSYRDYRVENSNLTKEPNDSITIAPNITEEVIALGEKMSEVQREAMMEKFSDVKFDSITRFYPLPVNLVLPYQHNQVTFYFLAIEPAKPFLVKYQYQLEGYDKDWSPVTDQTSASFGNIREGNYTFKVKTQSPDGVWTEPVLYSFKVRPPWYRSWWAYTLYGLIITVSLVSFIKWRLRRLSIEKAILEQKVALRTSELKEEKEKVESTLIELKTTQSQLIQSEKMASLGELTAGIAHEIQNPLNFVNNFSEINTELLNELKGERAKGKGERIETLEEEILNNITENESKILQHGKRADAIVKGMLQHSQKQTGVREFTDINQLAEEYLMLAYHSYRAKDQNFTAELKLDLDPQLPLVQVIPQDIGRVLLNVYNNALWACATKSRGDFEPPLDLRAYTPTITLSTKNLGDKVEIRIKDNGIGIPQNIIDKIFQPFFTTKPTGQGTGLGLSLAYDIVKAHDGTIGVDSEIGKGSDFFIHLPIS